MHTCRSLILMHTCQGDATAAQGRRRSTNGEGNAQLFWTDRDTTGDMYEAEEAARKRKWVSKILNRNFGEKF